MQYKRSYLGALLEGVQRIVVDNHPGYPCRISLRDAEVAGVIDSERLESLIERMLKNKSADYLHIHNAKLGCYAALVERG